MALLYEGKEQTGHMARLNTQAHARVLMQMICMHVSTSRYPRIPSSALFYNFIRFMYHSNSY